MNKNLTEVILILDRSGSMQTIKSDVEGGLKTFFEDQKKKSGDCRVSLYQFDTEYEPVFENIDIQRVGSISLTPRGGTALFDAIGRTVNAVGDRLNKTPENEKPAGVMIVVITDGEENSSREFTQEQVKKMIKHQTDKYSWDFVFIGSNQDAVTNGQKYGFALGKSITFSSNSAGVGAVAGSLSNYTAVYRNLVSQADSTVASATTAFTDKDREESNKHNN